MKVLFMILSVLFVTGCNDGWRQKATYGERKFFERLEDSNTNSCWKAKNATNAISHRVTKPELSFCDIKKELELTTLNQCSGSNTEVDELFPLMFGETLDEYCSPVESVIDDTKKDLDAVVEHYDAIINIIPLCGRSKFKINLLVEQKGGYDKITNADLKDIVISCKAYELEKLLQEKGE